MRLIILRIKNLIYSFCVRDTEIVLMEELDGGALTSLRK